MLKSADNIISLWGDLKGSRPNWETLWQNCADYILPRKSDVVRKTIAGRNQTLQIYDSTAVEANEKFAAGLYAYLCPPTQQWFTLLPGDDELKENEAVVSFFRQATELVYARLANSNFHQQAHEHFLDLGWCGTGNIYSEEDPELPGYLVFRNHHINNYVIAEDYQGRVDTVIRRVEYTARQAIQRFGEQAVSQDVRDAAEDPKKQNDKFAFLHAVGPNDDFNEDRQDGPSMRYSSIWVDEKAKQIVHSGGYHHMPYHVDRFEVGGEEIYGRSPGSRCLPTIKLVNAQQRTVLKAGQLAVDPPTLLPNDGSISSWRNTPGALNYWNAANPNAKPEQMQPTGRLDIGLEMIQANQRVILETFNVDLFTALAAAPRDMTATEVLERVEEKLTLLTPFLGRLQRELFDPLISRAFDLLFRAGVLPTDVPPELQEQPIYEIEYGGKLALALKQMRSRAFQNTLAVIGPLADMDPSVIDNFNMDKITRGIARGNAMPEEWLATDDEVNEKREARRAAAEAEAQLNAADQAAGAMQKTSKKPEEGSPAAELMKTGAM